jgi:acyl-CoA hydrolase
VLWFPSSLPLSSVSVTEYGIAELRGSSIRERTRKLIRIAHPKFHDELERQAREMNYL